MNPVDLADLYVNALYKNMHAIEKRLRENKNADGTEMTDKQRKFWKEQRRAKEKLFLYAIKKFNRYDDYEHYLEKEDERQMEEQKLREYEENF